MTTHTLTIPHTFRDQMRKSKLPFTTNEWRAAYWRKQNDAKKLIANVVWVQARNAGLCGLGLTGVHVSTVWFAPNALVRDSDSMGFFHKAALDSLVKSGVIVKDDWRHVLSSTTAVRVDRANPRICVEITEAE